MKLKQIPTPRLTGLGMTILICGIFLTGCGLVKPKEQISVEQQGLESVGEVEISPAVTAAPTMTDEETDKDAEEQLKADLDQEFKNIDSEINFLGK